jgi:hypothetical protein
MAREKTPRRSQRLPAWGRRGESLQALPPAGVAAGGRLGFRELWWDTHNLREPPMSSYADHITEITQSTFATTWQLGSKAFFENTEKMFEAQSELAAKVLEHLVQSSKTLRDQQTEVDQWAEIYRANTEQMLEVTRVLWNIAQVAQQQAQALADYVMRDSGGTMAPTFEPFDTTLAQSNAASSAALETAPEKARARRSDKRKKAKKT